MCTRFVDAPSKSSSLKDLIAATTFGSTTSTSLDQSCLRIFFTGHNHNLSEKHTNLVEDLLFTTVFSIGIFAITTTTALGGFFFRVNLVTRGMHT